MTDLDLFSRLTATMSLADQIADDTRLTAKEREIAALMRDSLKSWRGAAFKFREWQPAAVVTA
ncbi:hypothetical protein HF909_10685 [Ralstonia pseudosolanacearum]|uniref:Uncharacterized protein n=1 Tax=Ralstonia solanacearum TaxID=305 RepID=A0AA92K1X5_RALSL|nr:hypothetical protein [Ralstonia pseudosolanacearum]QOK96850.1 hypothetical protein HF909_10685 [Ralstonia pseudosolanacearum]